MQAKVIFPYPDGIFKRRVIGEIVAVDEKKYKRLLRAGFIAPFETATAGGYETAVMPQAAFIAPDPGTRRGRGRPRRK